MAERYAQDKGRNWVDLPDSTMQVPRVTTDEGSTTAEVVHARTYVWDTVGLVWVRATQAGGGGGGASDTELPPAAVITDNTANPTVPGVAGYGLIWDGATWDRAPGNSTDGTLVNLGANNDVTVTGTVTANAGSGPFPVSDNGGSLTVDGTVTANAGTGPFPVSDNGGSLTVDDGAGSLTVDGTVTANAGTGPWPVTDNGGSLTVDGTVTANAGTGPFPVSDNGGSLTVDGAVTVSGTVTSNVGTGPWPVIDNASSLTIDAPVATPVAARLSDGAAFLTTTTGRLSVDGSGVTQPVSGTVTANAGTGTWPGTLIGNGGTVAEVDGTAFRALRITQRPIDHGSLGHYRVATTVALVVTQAANGTLFSLRWGDATRFAVIQYIRLQVMQTAAATATIMPLYEIFQARSFSVSDSVGTAITLTTNNGKKRTSMGTTLMTDMRKSAVAAGLTAGTRTLDANPIIQLPTNSTITTPNATLYTTTYDAADGTDHPIVLAQNEGFIVRGPTVVFGAAGTANLVVEVVWAEVAAY